MLFIDYFQYVRFMFVWSALIIFIEFKMFGLTNLVKDRLTVGFAPNSKQKYKHKLYVYIYISCLTQRFLYEILNKNLSKFRTKFGMYYIIMK